MCIYLCFRLNAYPLYLSEPLERTPLLSQCVHQITDEMFIVAADTLASSISDEEIAKGKIYPDLSDLKSISALIAVKVMEKAYSDKLATVSRPEGDLLEYVQSKMWKPCEDY